MSNYSQQLKRVLEVVDVHGSENDKLAAAEIRQAALEEVGGDPLAWRDLEIGEAKHIGDRFMSADGEWVELGPEHFGFEDVVSEATRPMQRRALPPRPHIASGLVRYCYECGTIGEPGEGKRCCPDGHGAPYVPRKVAEQAREGFLSRIRASASEPDQILESLAKKAENSDIEVEAVYDPGPGQGSIVRDDVDMEEHVADWIRTQKGTISTTTPQLAPAVSDDYALGIAEQLARSDWTPEEALRWYAEGKHFDTVDGRTRIVDTGAVASNALKHLSSTYLEMKGDAELSELRDKLSESPMPVPTDWMQIIEQNCWDLRCTSEPTGGDDYDVLWHVIEHHMAEPHERTLASDLCPIRALERALNPPTGDEE